MHNCGRGNISATVWYALDTLDTMRLGCHPKLCYASHFKLTVTYRLLLFNVKQAERRKGIVCSRILMKMRINASEPRFLNQE